jgi:hypothetical protein
MIYLSLAKIRFFEVFTTFGAFPPVGFLLSKKIMARAGLSASSPPQTEASGCGLFAANAKYSAIP